MESTIFIKSVFFKYFFRWKSHPSFFPTSLIRTPTSDLFKSSIMDWYSFASLDLAKSKTNYWLLPELSIETYVWLERQVQTFLTHHWSTNFSILAFLCIVVEFLHLSICPAVQSWHCPISLAILRWGRCWILCVPAQRRNPFRFHQLLQSRLNSQNRFFQN